MKATLAAAALSLQAAHIFAAPTGDFTSNLAERDDTIWKNDEDGSIVTAVGDGKLAYGHLVPSSTLQAIEDNCSSLGCEEGAEFEHTAFVVNSDIGRETKIVMKVSGTFNPTGDRGSKSQLLEFAKLALQDVYNNGAATREEGVKYIKNPCPPNQVHGCPGQESGWTDQWVSTNSIQVRVNKDGDGGLAGNLKIKWERAEDDSGNGVCAALSAAGAGAGLANQYAGFGLSLASIVCGELSD